MSDPSRRDARSEAEALQDAAPFVELAGLTAGVKCGHTYPNPFNQADAGGAPDLLVRPSVRAIAQGSNAEMTAALAALG